MKKTEVLYKSDLKDGKKIRIIHFNDVYNINDPKGKSRSARFINAIEKIVKEEPTLVFFSGDAFSPSLLSSVFKGQQMVEILNLCHINAACVGNHEFDLGVDTMQSLVQQTNFPWLLSNVFDSETNKPLGGVETHTVLEHQGLKIGVIGIVEKNWISTLSTIDKDDVVFNPFIQAGKNLAYKLRKEDKVDIVIALTHMRRCNDELFVSAISEIDIVLGGHDHDYSIKQITDRWLIKSGVDFKEFTYLELHKTNNASSVVTLVERVNIHPDLPPHEEAQKIVDRYAYELEKNLDVVIGTINTDLDGRFTSVRTKETNLGNFLCDVIMQSADVHCCILNGGTIRSDRIHPKGKFTLRDLREILSFGISPVVVELRGEYIWKALENGVSQYPELEGRFPQVSGIQFAFDPSKPSFNRIEVSSIKIQNKPLDLTKVYKVATDKYLANGKDGYDAFKQRDITRDDENFPSLFDLVQNHFKTVNRIRADSNARLRPSLVPLYLINDVCDELSKDPNTFKPQYVKSDFQRLTFRTAALLIWQTLKLQRVALSRKDKKLIKQSSRYKEIIREHENKSLKLAPTVESRIICLKKIKN